MRVSEKRRVGKLRRTYEGAQAATIEGVGAAVNTQSYGWIVLSHHEVEAIHGAAKKFCHTYAVLRVTPITIHLIHASPPSKMISYTRKRRFMNRRREKVPAVKRLYGGPRTQGRTGKLKRVRAWIPLPLIRYRTSISSISSRWCVRKKQNLLISLCANVVTLLRVLAKIALAQRICTATSVLKIMEMEEEQRERFQA